MPKTKMLNGKLFYLPFLMNNKFVSSTIHTIMNDFDNLGWWGFKSASMEGIDFAALGYTGSGTYDNLVYSSTQAFMCGFRISCVGGDITNEQTNEGIDGFEAIFCHQDYWSI